MWIYEKRLEYPVRITKPDPRMAKLLMAQYGGPDSELGANKEIVDDRVFLPDENAEKPRKACAYADGSGVSDRAQPQPLSGHREIKISAPGFRCADFVFGIRLYDKMKRIRRSVRLSFCGEALRRAFGTDRNGTSRP